MQENQDTETRTDEVQSTREYNKTGKGKIFFFSPRNVQTGCGAHTAYFCLVNTRG